MALPASFMFFLSLALGVSRLHQIEPHLSQGFLDGLHDDAAKMLGDLAPIGVSALGYGSACAAFICGATRSHCTA